jgi:predicted dehydrogenase/glycosyltransferase involved in cell wall biosynthesis
VVDELLEMELDGIVIATPSALHAEQSIAALERGVAVFCQKPLGRSAEEARAVVDAARAADRLLEVDLSYRFTAAMRAVRDLVARGEIGHVYAADLVFHNAYGPDKPWFYDRALSGGGCVMDLGIHLVDMALWTLDFPRVSSVQSRLFAGGRPLAPADDAVEEFATATIGLESGASVRLACSWKLPAGADAEISATFYGTGGGVRMQNVNGSFYDFRAEHLDGTSRTTLVEPPDAWGGRAAVHWAQRLDGGERVRSRGRAAGGTVVGAGPHLRPVRILLSTDTVGGVWDHSVTLAGGLAERGCAVLLAVIGAEESLAGRAIPAGVEVTARPSLLEWMPGAMRELRPAAEWLGSLGRSWGAEVAHLNQMAYTGIGSPAIPTVVAAHSDVLSWFSEVRAEATGPEWEGYARAVRAGLRAANLVVTPSRYQSDLLGRHFGRPADRVIHNGVAAPVAGRSARREQLLITAGRAWDQAKGMDLLDRALAMLGDEAPPARLFGPLEGPGGERFHPARLIAPGAVTPDQLGGWMERASAYVAASRYEPFGLAPLEAAMRGCPLLLSDIGSFRELWEGCATFFRSGSSEALAEGIREVLEDPAGAATMADAARERALERHTADRMVDRYLELHRGLRAGALTAPLGGGA